MVDVIPAAVDVPFSVADRRFPSPRPFFQWATYASQSLAAFRHRRRVSASCRCVFATRRRVCHSRRGVPDGFGVVLNDRVPTPAGPEKEGDDALIRFSRSDSDPMGVGELPHQAVAFPTARKKGPRVTGVFPTVGE